MKKYIFLISIIGMVSLMSCEIKNNSKIIGKWSGTHEQKLYYTNKIYTRSCEIEFGNDGKGWSQLYNQEDDEKYPTKIFDYKIINDSIIFKSSKHPQNLKIEYVSDTKMVLKNFSQMTGTITYDLHKIVD